MKSVLVLACLATFAVYSQALTDLAYDASCTASDSCKTNMECSAAGKCACKTDSFPETVNSVTSCYKKIGSVTCDITTAPCHSTGTCSAAGACYCPATKQPDSNLQKCVAAGAAGIAASVLSLAVVVFSSRVL